VRTDGGPDGKLGPYDRGSLGYQRGV
jgi:hypothetical protein